jgi:DNA polymerase-3 subunit epsilon
LSINIKLTRDLVVLDLETTGLWIEKDKIIEIGLVYCGMDGSRKTFVRRINPGILIPAYVTQLTGIRGEDVQDAPAFGTLADEILAFIGEADFAGFNVERFDLPLLEREFFEAGKRFEWRHRTIYDAQKIYHIHEKRDLKAAYRFYCGKDLANAHSALGDGEATLEILAEQIRRYGGSEYLESLIDFDYEPTRLFFDDERKFRWWNGELYPVFGKYGRKLCLKEILAKDRGYLEYLANTDFDETVKEMLRGVLAGKHPEPEAAAPRRATPRKNSALLL